MRPKKLIYLLTASILCGSFLFTSCKKKEAEDSDTEGAKDHTLVETFSNDITNIGTQASYNNISTYKVGHPDQVYTSCAIIKFDTLNNTDADTLEVDFGSVGCAGADGRSRKGALSFIYTAGKHYRDSGNVISVTTPGNTYYVNGNQVIVNNKTITNKGHITNGMLTWNIIASISVVKSSGGTVTWSTNKTKVLLAGEKPNNQPIDWPNARIGMYGDASGTTAKGEAFTVHIDPTHMLERNFTCTNARRYFVAGILEFTPGTKPTRYVNFGTGTCDNQAVITINGHTFNVTLP
jgi:hypothetical protein